MQGGKYCYVATIQLQLARGGNVQSTTVDTVDIPDGASRSAMTSELINRFVRRVWEESDVDLAPNAAPIVLHFSLDPE